MGKVNGFGPSGPPRPGGLKRLCRKGFRAQNPASERRFGGRETDGYPKGRRWVGRGLAQRPLKSGFRFSRKASIPSFMSAVEARRPKSADSKSSASVVEVSRLP